MGPNNAPRLDEVLPRVKELLKKEGLTYVDVSKALGISHSSVKKLFMGPDISLSRILKICDLIGTDFSSILEEIQARTFKPFTFTSEQEAMLLKDESYFKLYWLLAVEEKTLEQIKKIYSVDNHFLYSILRKLDDLSLIKWMSDENIQTPPMNLVIWKNVNELAIKIRKKWPQMVFNKALKNMHKSDYKTSFRFLQLTKQSYHELFTAIENLILEFDKKSLREIKSKPKHKILPVSLCYALIPEGYIEKF